MVTEVVQILPYFSEVSKQTIFYNSRSSKDKNSSVFKKCLDRLPRFGGKQNEDKNSSVFKKCLDRLPRIGGKQNVRLTLQFYQLIKCRFTVTNVEAKSHLTFLEATSNVL